METIVGEHEHSGIKRLDERILKNSDQMKKGLSQIGQSNMLKATDAIINAMKTANSSIGRILSAKKSVLTSEAAVQKAIETVKSITKEQSRQGEEQVSFDLTPKHLRLLVRGVSPFKV
ncbi:MAG: hypothetical protein AB1478_03645 [Nitrospirota bacterium]